LLTYSANDLPLAGLKIAVTRPRDQAARLARHIEQAGGIPLLFPLLDIAPAQDQRVLREQISRLAEFDLAIFISPNAVQYGMAAIRAAGELPQKLKIATVGQGSAKALRELGIAEVIAPAERFDSEGLLALPELQHVAGWRVLILRGDGGRELLGDTLRARGAVMRAPWQASRNGRTIMTKVTKVDTGLPGRPMNAVSRRLTFPKARGLPGLMAICHKSRWPRLCTAGLIWSSSPTDTPPLVRIRS